MFNNIIVWGPTVEDFLIGSALDHVQLWGVAEHHLRGEDLGKLSTAARLAGRNAFPTAARKTKSRYHSGGTALMPKKHLALGNAGRIEAIENKNAHTGTDWSAIPVRPQGSVVVFGAAYLTHSQGVGGDNTQKFREIGNLLVSDGRPFVFLGDWNMTPQQFQSSAGGWLKLIRGAIVTPKHATQTCLSGRLLDFAVGSWEFVLVIELEWARGTPWTTHNGLQLRLKKKPGTVESRALSVPVRLDTLPMVPSQPPRW